MLIEEIYTLPRGVKKERPESLGNPCGAFWVFFRYRLGAQK